MATTHSIDRQDLGLRLLLAIVGIALAAVGWLRWILALG
jgi:hypothetical protein